MNRLLHRLGRPGLHTSYAEDSGIFANNVQRVAVTAGAIGFIVLAFALNEAEDRVWLLLLSTAFVYSIGSIGLNLVTGYAGQVSLGHAFFFGVGAYAAAALGGNPATDLIALGLDMWIWIPGAGLVAALAGVVVAPIALRLKGLYLALVTIGLVFLGEHIFRSWTELTGGQGQGREPARMSLFGYRFDLDGNLAGISVSKEQQIYLVTFVLMVILTLLAKNLVRSRVGRAFAAVRDRDIAAEIMGVNLTRYKVVAFAISSFYAGVAGAVFYSITGFVEPNAFNLLLSVTFIAMVVIGGASSIAGSLMGAFFIALLPKFIELVLRWLPVDPTTVTEAITTNQIERILFGVLIIVFLILEPLGLYGIWIRVRNYWKAFPFSY